MADPTIRVNVTTDATAAAGQLDKLATSVDKVGSSSREASAGVRDLGDTSGDTSSALSYFAQAASAMGLDGLATGLDTATIALDSAEGATILWRTAIESATLAKVKEVVQLGLTTAATAANMAATWLANAASVAWTATSYALGAALRFMTGPIGIIITVVALLAAGIIYLWNNNETFRTVVTNVWNGIKTAISAVVSWFTDTVIPMFQRLWDNARPVLEQLRDKAGTIFNAIKAAIDPVIGAFQTLVGWIKDAINFVSQIHVPDWLSGLPGIGGQSAAAVAGPSAVTTAWTAPGVSAAAYTAPTVPTGRLGTPALAAAGGGVVVQVMVPPTANPVETGRQIVNMIRRFESSGSNQWRMDRERTHPRTGP